MMKNDEKKQNDEQLKATKEQTNTNLPSTETDKDQKKESLAERAQREQWTDVAESHLGIDE
jgi:hypothetical protein